MFLKYFLYLFLGVFLTATAGAQPYPNRPIRFLVPGASGSSQDILSRVLATKLSQQLGQQVVVDARAGASGLIAIDLAKGAAPDGYTLIAATSTLFAGLPALKPKLSYDPDRDFAPLSRMAAVANVVTVNANLGVESAADLVKLAKSKPGQLNYGSAGNGSPAHLAGAMFDVLAGVKTLKWLSMARRTGMPASDDFIWTMLASCPAPIQTNSAIKISTGLPWRPTKANKTAMP